MPSPWMHACKHVRVYYLCILRVDKCQKNKAGGYLYVLYRQQKKKKGGLVRIEGSLFPPLYACNLSPFSCLRQNDCRLHAVNGEKNIQLQNRFILVRLPSCRVDKARFFS